MKNEKSPWFMHARRAKFIVVSTPICKSPTFQRTNSPATCTYKNKRGTKKKTPTVGT